MKKLVLLVTTALIAMSATGCIISSGDDSGDDVGEEATITAKWSIKNLASNNNNLPCPPGINTAALYSQALDNNNEPVGSPQIDLFTCSDFQGAAAIEPDVYQSWVEFTTGSGGSVYAKSLSAIVDVVQSDKTFETTILEDGGYFELSWDLVDSITRAPLTCAQAGSNGVSSLATEVNNGSNSKDDVFPCEDHYGVTGGLKMGTYTVDVEAIDSTEEPLGDNPTLLNKIIVDKNGVTDLGNLQIPVD